MMKNIVLLLLLLVSFSLQSVAQEMDENITQATTYLESRTVSLQKYLKRTDKIHQRLLRKLKRKEDKMLRKLAAKDSALYYQYVSKTMSYDAIAVLSGDSSYRKQQSLGRNSVVDSLKGVQNFIQQQNNKISNLRGKAAQAGVDIPYTKELADLQGKLNTQTSIDALIGQRTSALGNLAGKGNISGIQSIQKQVYYAKEKIKAWKDLADEPDDAEEEAVEYLQGTQGFAESLKGSSGSNAFGGLGNNATAEDLQRLGFQTKSQVNNMLQQKLGNNLGAVQQQMADQVKDYSEKLSDITGAVKEVKQTLSEVKEAKNSLKNIKKPTFKKNPERGKPFWQRLQPQYNFQTTRAAPDGLRPAMLEPGAGLEFKHIPKLSYGLVAALSIGLGQNWQNIKLTYEGISARAYADWKLIYGFSAQAGYERIFRPANRPYLPTNADPDNSNNNPNNSDNIFKETFGGQQQAAYIGIMKWYRINSKWNGTFLAGYNFLWKEEGLRSPWLLRFGWGG